MSRRSLRSPRLTIPLAAALGLAMTGLTAVPAGAATVSVYVSGDGYLYYTATSGETNDVTASSTASTITITDPGAPITAGDGCTVSGATATCDGAGVVSLYFFLGDGNDSLVTSSPIAASVNAGEGNDTVTTGSPRDYINTGPGVDVVNSGAGDDYVSTGPGVKTVNSGDGNDYVVGGSADDNINLGAGNDYASPGPGADNIVGGSGQDAVTYQSRTSNLSISLNDVADDGESGESDNVHSDIENVYTGSGNDTVTGSSADNYISTVGGNDVLNGMGGRDSLAAGDGSDVLNGSDGNDYLYDEGGADDLNGGEGNDEFYSYANTTGSDDLSGGPGIDQVFFYGYLDVTVTLDGSANDGRPGDAADNVRPDIEDISTGDGNDRIIGSKAANELSGGEGNDTINGKKGSDGLDGGRGADNLIGGPGVDSLLGGAGADKVKSQDKSADYVVCGSSVDRVNRDRKDQVMADCEKLS